MPQLHTRMSGPTTTYVPDQHWFEVWICHKSKRGLDLVIILLLKKHTHFLESGWNQARKQASKQHLQEKEKRREEERGREMGVQTLGSACLPAPWNPQTCGTNMLPQGMFLIFLKGWELEFPNSSHQILLVPINIPSKFFCSHQVPKQFPSNSSCSHQYPIKILLISSSCQKIPIKFLLFPSVTHQKSFCSHQIPLIPINNPSISFCSHQVPIKFLLFPSRFNQIPFVPIKFLSFLSITYQYPFVLIKFPKKSHQIPLVPIKFPSKSFCSHGYGV